MPSSVVFIGGPARASLQPGIPFCLSGNGAKKIASASIGVGIMGSQKRESDSTLPALRRSSSDKGSTELGLAHLSCSRSPRLPIPAVLTG